MFTWYQAAAGHGWERFVQTVGWAGPEKLTATDFVFFCFVSQQQE